MHVVTAVLCTGADSVPSSNKQILLVLLPVLAMLSKLIENKFLFFYKLILSSIVSHNTQKMFMTKDNKRAIVL